MRYLTTRLSAVVAVTAMTLTAMPGQADAALSSFQEGVSPTGGYAHDATYIRSTDPNGNQNGDPDLELIVGTTQTGDVIRSLLEFDVSAIPVTNQIDSVSLVLTTHSNTGLDNGGEPGDPTFNVYSYGFDIDETTATWNAPDSGASDVAGGTLGTLLTSASFDVTNTGVAVTFGDTAPFRSAIANALAIDGFLRLIVAKSDESTVSTHEFARFAADSFGTAGDRPELLVTHSVVPDVVPEPSTATLTVLGLLGLGLLRLRRRGHWV